jgi:hypothetical protein
MRFPPTASQKWLRLNIWRGRPPRALTPPLNAQDFGTSRWRLTVERYTNCPAIWKGCWASAIYRRATNVGQDKDSDTRQRGV